MSDPEKTWLDELDEETEEDLEAEAAEEANPEAVRRALGFSLDELYPEDDPDE
jgi:hypothetical protein